MDRVRRRRKLAESRLVPWFVGENRSFSPTPSPEGLDVGKEKSREERPVETRGI
jgi:hypothetical protein